MNDVKSYTFTLFCAALASALLELLAPESQKKQLSFMLGLFMLICFLSPIADMLRVVDSISLTAAKSEIIPIDTDELLKNEFSARVKKIIEEKLDSLGIFDADIGIEINISGQSAEISGITITLPTEYSGQKGAIESLLLNELDIAAEIKIAGG